MFVKKYFIILFFLTFILSGIGLSASGYYDLSENVEEINLPVREKNDLENLVKNFLTRVKNGQNQIIVENMLFIPDKTFQGRPLTKDEISLIKKSFLKGLKEDSGLLKKAELAEIRKYRIIGPDYALSKNPDENVGHDINLRIIGQKDYIPYQKRSKNIFRKIAPMHIYVMKKNGKFLISSYDIWLNYPTRGTIKEVPMLPDSVDPRAD